ncbi:DNA mismatch repair endonuclease MutL [Thalassotalea agarivorans]|uniref:DNA mismatch repair protein MutL n=1 Tax=Thalassotalea agarivorans TaxID=349064 RepID=A0A1I0CH23_THASX|nr:DNA mismatch repair endonuclease MutL [Thalassotalea agarivorans]SET18888.1 DNA mismatch repair protein MutL [Thalassotalea agarivorans]
MSIAILPTRLANQIAAGEVVERPASVVKELVENSLDAGAKHITVTIDKGGAKRIKITDDGCGIDKDELVLALSRHATSKIKDFDDLEGIASLGFRGEALASISSVARLTLTSKPEKQSAAWQAQAFGRDMAVKVSPAAHPDGTSIDVQDLFFNTPARRKFLRTEKTEFSHIEEVIKRIALARMDVAFTLIHNGKTVKQFRQAANTQQRQKRIGQICGNGFIDNAIEINCQHDGLTLSGWIAAPSFARSQNDLCYSYVNGRMMRDKLINHAIRQAYDELLPSDMYPAFILYLDLDVREVDVNVHPAKHEVRFHQARYVHDFIYSVCHRALAPSLTSEFSQPETVAAPYVEAPIQSGRQYQQELARVTPSGQQAKHLYGQSNTMSTKAAQVYQQLLQGKADSPAIAEHQPKPVAVTNEALPNYVYYPPHFIITTLSAGVHLTDLNGLALAVTEKDIAQRWSQGFVSQPLLLPVTMTLSAQAFSFVCAQQAMFAHIGFDYETTTQSKKVKITHVPAAIREKNVSELFLQFVSQLLTLDEAQESQWYQPLALIFSPKIDDELSANKFIEQAHLLGGEEFNQLLHLNSQPLDLTSTISAFTK